MTTETSKDGAITVSYEFLRIRIIFSRMLNTECHIYSSSVMVRVIVMIRFSVWLVSGYAEVFVLLSVVIVTLPLTMTA